MPKSKAKQDADLPKRIEKYTDKRGPDECWPWTGPQCGDGAKDGKGYPSLTVNRKKKLVTRMIYERTHGAVLTSDQQVCHSCDNPPCVNPAHFFLGDSQANHEDMARKGRSTATIKPEVVVAIAIDLKNGLSYSKTAKRNRVSTSAVAHIAKRRCRRNLTENL